MLFSLFDDISTSWIILPRAYCHLEELHSQCLLVYLDYLDKESNPEFRKILARIITEFTGNFTLKHTCSTHPKDRMIEALFYGYAAMFWKNLRSPPTGFEDGGIFENFLHWARMYQKRSPSIPWEKAEMIDAMEEEREKAFAVTGAFGRADDNLDGVERFLVTLRHGLSGIDTVVKYFGVGSSLLKKNATDGGIPYVAVPKVLSLLFKKIKKSYSVEAPRTQEFIGEFLLKLKAAYDSKRIDLVFCGGHPPDQLRFVGPRVRRMVHDFTESIAV
jgi:hypothetical protein